MPKAASKLLLSVLLTAGCQRQPQRVLVAAPPAPAAQHATSPPPIEVSPPPQVDTPAPPATTLPPAAPVEVPPAPPLPARAKKKRPAPAKKEAPVVAAPDLPEPAPAPAPAPVPQLSEVISPQRKHGMDADIDRAIHSAQINLQAVAGKNLTAQQTAAAAQAASFLRQAVDIRPQDLSSALSLAQRAEVIARDLAKTVK